MHGMPVSGWEQMYLAHNSVQPYEVKGQANWEVETEKRYLYAKIASIYDFTIPDTWPIGWFRFFLFRLGSIAVLYTKEYGWVTMPYGYSRLNLYYQPKIIEVYNHMFPNVKTGVIGVNAEIIKIMDDYRGLDDLVRRYAEVLANINKSANISLMNSNVSVYYPAANPKDARDIEEAYAQATEGKPMVAVNKKLMQEGQEIKPLLSSPKDNFIVTQLLEARRNVVNMFLTDVGIPNTNVDKRAQKTTDELLMNSGETHCISAIIMENLKTCFEKANRISGLNLSVKYREEVYNNGQTDALGNEQGV